MNSDFRQDFRSPEGEEAARKEEDARRSGGQGTVCPRIFKGQVGQTSEYEGPGWREVPRQAGAPACMESGLLGTCPVPDICVHPATSRNQKEEGTPLSIREKREAVEVIFDFPILIVLENGLPASLCLLEITRFPLSATFSAHKLI